MRNSAYARAGWLLLLAGSLVASHAAGTALPNVVLTAQENGLINQTEFMAHGIIYGYIRLVKAQRGKHLLESIWKNPAGKIVVSSQSEVDYEHPSSTAQVWFAFPEKNGFGLVDPSVDEALADVGGLWHLTVLWDGQFLLETSFKVES